MYINIHTCIYRSMHIHMYIFTCIYVCVFFYIWVNVWTCTWNFLVFPSVSLRLHPLLNHLISPCLFLIILILPSLRRWYFSVPGWHSRLSIWLLCDLRIMRSRLHWAPHSARSLLGILHSYPSPPSLPCSPLTLICLKKKKKKLKKLKIWLVGFAEC